MAHISINQIKQRSLETKLVKQNYDARQRQIRESKAQFRVTVEADGFIFPEIVGANDIEEAVQKVRRSAWREWGMDVDMDKIACTFAEKV